MLFICKNTVFKLCTTLFSSLGTLQAKKEKEQKPNHTHCVGPVYLNIYCSEASVWSLLASLFFCSKFYVPSELKRIVGELLLNEPCVPVLDLGVLLFLLTIMFLFLVPTIGFEQTQYSVRENDTVGTEVCVSVMAPPSLGSTVTVMLVSMDGTAQGKNRTDPLAQ